jgi:NAD(P)-dependent dehydrogenase (short-subunit alcohol dehydrogenase family)
VPFALTVDGFESQIGTNHLGHFALTNLLLPKVTDRVVTVASMMHVLGRINLEDLNWKSRPYRAWPAYGQSKLANLLFTKELQRRLGAAGSRVKALVAHPGYSATELQSHSAGLFGKVFQTGNSLVATPPDFGARQTLYAASQDLPGDTYVGPRLAMWGPTGPTPLRSPLARDGKKATALWELSEQLTDTKFPL